MLVTDTDNDNLSEKKHLINDLICSLSSVRDFVWVVVLKLVKLKLKKACYGLSCNLEKPNEVTTKQNSQNSE